MEGRIEMSKWTSLLSTTKNSFRVSSMVSSKSTPIIPGKFNKCLNRVQLHRKCSALSLISIKGQVKNLNKSEHHQKNELMSLCLVLLFVIFIINYHFLKTIHFWSKTIHFLPPKTIHFGPKMYRFENVSFFFSL